MIIHTQLDSGFPGDIMESVDSSSEHLSENLAMCETSGKAQRFVHGVTHVPVVLKLPQQNLWALLLFA